MFKAMIIKFFIKVFSFSINAKMMYSIVFMFIMLLKMFKSIKHVEFDTKHIIINRLIKSHKNVTKYLILSLNTKNWTRSLYIKFKKCLSKITRLSCDSTFCLIIVHDSQRFLFAMSLIKFILSNILTSRCTFCFFKCFNRACHTFRMFLLIVIFDSSDDIAKLSTINMTMKL